MAIDYYPPAGDDVLQLFDNARFAPDPGDYVVLKFGDYQDCIIYYPPPGTDVHFQMEVDTVAATYFKTVDIDMCEWRSGVAFYLITGFAYTQDGEPIVNAIVTSDNSYYRAYTGAGGFYALPVPEGTAQHVTIYHPKFEFTPETREVAMESAMVPDVDFTGIQIAWAVSGHLENVWSEPLAGTRVEISGTYTHRPGGKFSFTETNASGDYLFDANYSGDYTLTPVLANYEFEPLLRDVIVAGSRQEHQDFTGYELLTVSGQITNASDSSPVPGVPIQNSNGPDLLTDTSGDYTITVRDGTAYRLTPTDPGDYVFNPAWRDLNIERSGLYDQDFVRYQGYRVITGEIVDGSNGNDPAFTVQVEVSGDMVDQIPVAVGQRYFTVVPGNSNYTVAPSHPWYDFTPAQRTYAPIVADELSGDFTATYLPDTHPGSGTLTIDRISRTGIVWENNTTLEVSCHDDRWMVSVDLYMDETLLVHHAFPSFHEESLSGMDYTFAWDQFNALDYPEGFYTLRAKLTDGGGNVAWMHVPIEIYHAPDTDTHIHQVTHAQVQDAIGWIDTGDGDSFMWEHHMHPLTLPPYEGVIHPSSNMYRRTVNLNWVKETP